MADVENEEEDYSEEEEEDIPLEQKLKICNFFVGATCAGEQATMVKNLQHFFKEYKQEDADSHLINRAEKCCQVVDGTIISDWTKSGDGYIDSAKGKIVSVSVEKNVVKTKEEGDSNASDEAKALQEELGKYMESAYHQDANKAVAVVDDGDDLKIITSADRINLSNFWTGHMYSRFTASGGNVSGTITFKLHYFENGNVMCDGTKEVKYEKAGSSPKEIRKAIQTLETEYQKAWSEYLSAQDKSILNVRRALTLQKTKFDWRLNQANMVQALG